MISSFLQLPPTLQKQLNLFWALSRTPHGLIEVSADRSRVEVDSPVPVEIRLEDGGVVRGEAGRVAAEIP